MMKEKKAFSLIEVLMVMGIIAVVTAMGFSISNKGVERAYNLYWYTGYSAIASATYDAIMHDKFDREHPNLCSYANHLKKLMKAESYSCLSTNAEFTAPNDIVFKIEPESVTGNRGYYKITMTIPKPKIRGTFPNETVFIFNLNDPGYIYPSNSVPDGYMNLNSRVDLLPFYVKTENPQNIKTFFGFREAYCKAGKPSIANMGAVANISCTGITPNQENDQGEPISANPRKVF